jgi:hypothetical protein
VTVVWYYCPDDGDRPEDAQRIELENVTGESDLDGLAEDLAKEIYDFHDGWEATWPMKLAVLREDKTPWFTATVEMEMEPVFYSHGSAVESPKA